MTIGLKFDFIKSLESKRIVFRKGCWKKNGMACLISIFLN